MPPKLVAWSPETALHFALKSSLSVAPSRPAAWFTPFALLPLQKLPHYYEVIRPCGVLWYSMSHGGRPLDTLPSHHSDMFPRSIQGPKSHSRHVYAGGQLASKQVPANLVPGLIYDPGFDHHLILFDTSSMVHFHSTLRSSPNRFLHLPFPYTLTTIPLKYRSCGWFATSACTAVAGGRPPSLAQFNTSQLSHRFTSYVFSWHTIYVSDPRVLPYPFHGS